MSTHYQPTAGLFVVIKDVDLPISTSAASRSEMVGDCKGTIGCDRIAPRVAIKASILECVGHSIDRPLV